MQQRLLVLIEGLVNDGNLKDSVVDGLFIILSADCGVADSKKVQ